jgi:hypothetical protein
VVIFPLSPVEIRSVFFNNFRFAKTFFSCSEMVVYPKSTSSPKVVADSRLAEVGERDVRFVDKRLVLLAGTTGASIAGVGATVIVMDVVGVRDKGEGEGVVEVEWMGVPLVKALATPGDGCSSSEKESKKSLTGTMSRLLYISHFSSQNAFNLSNILSSGGAVIVNISPVACICIVNVTVKESGQSIF